MKRLGRSKGGPSKPRTLVMTIGLGAAVVAYAFGVFLPGQRATAELRKQLREKRMAIMQADRLLYPIYDAETELSRAKEFLDKSKAAAPAEDEIASVMAEVHRRALATGVEVVRFEPRKPTSLETVNQHPVAVTLEGRFHAVWTFLHKLETLEAPLWISDLRVDPKEGLEDELQLELVLTVFSDKEKNSR
jgi:Tfp pilus assembly protein PilO